MTNKRYIRVMFGLSALLPLMVGAVNLAIDPYGIFGAPLKSGWNEAKPEAGRWITITKPLALWDRNADALFLGSSRAAVGLNPLHPALKDVEAYNLSLNGSSMQQVRAIFDHACLVHMPRRVVFGVDFFAFNRYYTGRTDFDPSLLATGTSADRWLSQLKKLGLALSWQTLLSSIKTLQSQEGSSARARELSVTGQTQSSTMELQIKRQGNQRKAFLSNETMYASDRYLPLPKRIYDLALQSSTSPMAELRHIVQASRMHGIELQLFISPVHARQLEVIRGLGLWDVYEDWKRALVTMLAEEAQQAHKTPFPLWDFSGYNSITTEPVPSQGDATSRMRWYWESSHYRSETGDQILNRMFGFGTSPYADFGVSLNQITLESHLAAIRAARENYVHKQAADAAEVAGLITDANKNRRPMLVSR